MADTFSDNHLDATGRGVPQEMTCYRVDISSGTVFKVELPKDLKVVTVQSPVAAELSVGMRATDGGAVTPDDLTNGNDARKLPLAASTKEPIVQQSEFNTLFIRPSANDATTVKIWVGSGLDNGLTGSGFVS